MIKPGTRGFINCHPYPPVIMRKDLGGGDCWVVFAAPFGRKRRGDTWLLNVKDFTPAKHDILGEDDAA